MVIEILEKLAPDYDFELLLSKNSDYTGDKGNFHSNFEQVADAVGLSVRQVFQVLIGIKVVRLLSLTDKEPNHESLVDTVTDMKNYMLLYRAWEVKQFEEGYELDKSEHPLFALALHLGLGNTSWSTAEQLLDLEFKKLTGE